MGGSLTLLSGHDAGSDENETNAEEKRTSMGRRSEVLIGLRRQGQSSVLGWGLRECGYEARLALYNGSEKWDKVWFLSVWMNSTGCRFLFYRLQT